MGFPYESPQTQDSGPAGHRAQASSLPFFDYTAGDHTRHRVILAVGSKVIFIAPSPYIPRVSLHNKNQRDVKMTLRPRAAR